MKSTRYCAIIGDIVGSRKLPHARKVHERFETAIAAINKEFGDAIRSSFLVAEGDDCQGLLHTPAFSYIIARRIQYEMAEIPMRFGVGIGTLNTKIKPVAIGMNGEAFHRARAALDFAKLNDKKIVYDYNDPAATLVNSIIEILDSLISGVNKNSLVIFRMAKRDLNQTDIASQMNITQQAVSKILNNKKLKQIIRIEDALNGYLSQRI